MHSIMSQAVIAINAHKVIKQNDLYKLVAQTTGFSVESVRGTLAKATGGLHDPVVLNKECIRFDRAAGHFEAFADASAIEDLYSYKSVEKQKSREFIANNITISPLKRIVTFGGHEGLCVKYFQLRFPDVTITNVEKRPDVVAAFDALNLGVTTVVGSFSDVRAALPPVDLINYDAAGYWCAGMRDDMRYLNNRPERCQFIALTVGANKSMRNHGSFTDFVTRTYKGVDPVLLSIQDTLNKYKLMAPPYYYSKENREKAVKMRTLLFKRN